MLDFEIMQCQKKKEIIKSIKCDMSNFSEFYQDYEYASHVLFSLGWIFADFVRWQPAVFFTTSCCLQPAVW